MIIMIIIPWGIYSIPTLAFFSYPALYGKHMYSSAQETCDKFMVSLPALPKVLSGKQGCLQMKTYWTALFFCFAESALQNKCNTQVHCFLLYYLKLYKVLFQIMFFYIYIYYCDINWFWFYSCFAIQEIYCSW